MITKKLPAKNTVKESLGAKPSDETPIGGEVKSKTPKKQPPANPSRTAKTVAAAGEIEKALETTVKKKKPDNGKVIRDSFSFPEQDYMKISELKKNCLAAGIHVKKGELLRAGLQLLSQLTIVELKKAVGQVEKIKTGRPKS